MVLANALFYRFKRKITNAKVLATNRLLLDMDKAQRMLYSNIRVSG
jgi:uncharacterized membrane protein